jgi:hypothetical protein
MIYLRTYEDFDYKDEMDNYQHKATNQLVEEFAPTYSDFEKVNLEEFVGYKVAEKINLNYYSVISGMFRYKPGKINHNSYSSLYKRNKEFFDDHLLNRLSVFKNKEDAIKSLEASKSLIKNWSNGNNDLVLMEITIADNIESAKFTNNYITNAEVYIGGNIKRVKEIQII